MGAFLFLIFNKDGEFPFLLKNNRMKFNLIIISSLFSIISFAQTIDEYKRNDKEFNDFYESNLNIFMIENNHKLNIQSWDLKTVKIKFAPEEGVRVLLKEDVTKYSKIELDSLKVKNWHQGIYTISIIVNLTNGEQDTIYLFLCPNGNLQLMGEYFHLWNKNK